MAIDALHSVDIRSLTYPHLCLCGCGQVTPIAQATRKRTNTVRGLPMAFVPNHCKVTRPIIDGHKECGDCKKVLPVEQFWKNKSRSDRRQHRCKECSKASVYGWREGNVKYIAYRQNDRLHRFSLTQADYDGMLLKQNGLCAICKQPERARFKGKLKRLAVDHCHKTGRVRGLLCQSCNRGIGYLADDADRVAMALIYLKESVS